MKVLFCAMSYFTLFFVCIFELELLAICCSILLQTDYEGQAKKLMELMEQTDMLIIAGGDGTLQEVQKYLHKVVSDNLSIFKCFHALYFTQVITGLLRRADEVVTNNNLKS